MSFPRGKFVRLAAIRLLRKCGVTEPPVDLRVIAEKSGLCYEEVDYFPEEVGALIISINNREVAVVNKNQPISRRRFSLARELYPHLLYKDILAFEGNAITSSPSSGSTADQAENLGRPLEAEAEVFAGELLVPLFMLKKYFRPGLTAADLARMFAVSESVASIAITSHFDSLSE